MEVCAPCGEAISESVIAGPSLLSADDLKENPQNKILNCLVSTLENSITEHLHIKDMQKPESLSNGDGDGAVNNAKKGEYLFENLELCPLISSSESSIKCTNSPSDNVISLLQSISSDVKEDKAEVKPKTYIEELVYEDGQSDSSPLVSAMKGSREKHGLSLMKLNVTWAPDVYDPIPTSVSHSVTRGKNKQRLYNKRNSSKKKNGKNKQKGSTSRGSGSSSSSSSSGSKDKKQSRKVSSAAYDKFVDEDLEVGSPDYCGNGFLMQSLTKVQYSIAEAL